MRRILTIWVWLVYGFMYLPIAIIGLFSLNASEMIAFPLAGFTVEWYVQAARDERLLRGLGVAFLIGIPAALLSTVLGAMAALAITRCRFRGKLTFVAAVVVPFFVPKIILAVADLISLSAVGMPRNLVTIVLAQVLIILPFTAMVIASVLVRLDRRLEEAASDLGASGWQVFSRVLLPLMGNGLLAAYLLAFVLSTSEYVVTSFVSGRVQPLSILVASDFRFHLSPKLDALAMMIVLANVLVIGAAEFARRRAGSHLSSS